MLLLLAHSFTHTQFYGNCIVEAGFPEVKGPWGSGNSWRSCCCCKALGCVLVLMLLPSTVFILWSKMKWNRMWDTHIHTLVQFINFLVVSWLFVSSGLTRHCCLSYNIRGLEKKREGGREGVVVVWSLPWLSGLVEVTQGRHVALPPSPSSSHYSTYCQLFVFNYTWLSL